jgi:hypothetical protein
MATVTRTETHKRGFFGWIFLLMFWGFNALMLFAVIAGANGSAEQATALTSDAERAGHAIGTAIGFSMLLFLWAAGAIIFGLLSYFTRGKKVIVETIRD